MKKSKVVNLIFVAGMFASCQSPKDDERESRMYVRGDTASQYSHTHYYGGANYFFFHPYGFYYPGYGFRHSGYESSHFSSKATNTSVSRGGFGSTGIRVGS